MDPISHALFAKTFQMLDERQRLGPGASAALVVGGLLPDVDVVRVLQGWDVYLLHHETGTHTVWAAAVEGALLALVLRSLVGGARFAPLWLAATLGTLAHVLLDFAGGSDMRLLHPVSDVRAGWHLMAMWEPVVVLGLVALHLVSWRKRRRAAMIFLAAFAVFLITKSVTQRAPLSAYASRLEGDLVRIEEVRGSLTGFRWFVRTRDAYRVFHVRAFGEPPRLLFEREPGARSGLVRSSRDYPVVRHLWRIGEMPLVWVEPSAPMLEVHWSDMQFCGPDRCAMSFGVAFDDGGEAVFQFVDVAGIRQTRPARRQDGLAWSTIE